MIVSALLLLTVAACSRGDGATAVPQPAGEINVYSGRHYPSDIALFQAFTEETGIKVNVIEAAGDALIERMVSEGAGSPADIFLTADAGMLWRADQRGLFQPLESSPQLMAIPAQFRHPKNHWVALSKRARVIIFDRDARLPLSIDSYEDLADPALRGMVCIRSSSNIYNQSLLAAIIAHRGPEAAEAWARGVASNFARKPQGNDTNQIEAVASGACRIAVVNSYYLARYVAADDPVARAVSARVGVIFPDQDRAAGQTGAHVNISGVGVLARAPNAANAQRLVAFLLRPSSQEAFARGNNEYPVLDDIAPVGPLATFGPFVEDSLPVSALGEHQHEAVRIFDRVGWQ